MTFGLRIDFESLPPVNQVLTSRFNLGGGGMIMNLAIIAMTTVGLGTHHAGAVQFTGMYVEGCSCSAPCPCEITGLSMGCQGVGGFSIAHGSFEDADVSGVKFAYATTPGDWVICYVDAPDAARRTAGAALAKAAFGGWGKMGEVK